MCGGFCKLVEPDPREVVDKYGLEAGLVDGGEWI